MTTTFECSFCVEHIFVFRMEFDKTRWNSGIMTKTVSKTLPGCRGGGSRVVGYRGLGTVAGVEDLGCGCIQGGGLMGVRM